MLRFDIGKILKNVMILVNIICDFTCFNNYVSVNKLCCTFIVLIEIHVKSTRSETFLIVTWVIIICHQTFSCIVI